MAKLAKEDRATLRNILKHIENVEQAVRDYETQAADPFTVLDYIKSTADEASTSLAAWIVKH